MSDIADWLEGLSEKSPAAAMAAQMIRSQDPEADIQALFGQAEQMVEEFGPDPSFPDRPNHPDFRTLARIIQQMDAEADDNTDLPAEQRNVVESLLPFGVDPDSVIYMAKQRAHRAEDLLSEEGTFYAKAVIMWLDAFTAGVKFGRQQAVTLALDDSIDGSRRSGRAR